MNKTKAIQYFSNEQIEQFKKLSPTQIATFLEDFRVMHSDPGKSKLISIKIPERLLNVFRAKCEALDVPYQTQIKRLMSDYIS